MFKRIISVGLVGVMSLGFATGVFADTKTNDVDITIEAGEFSLTTPNIDSFGNITLESTAQSHRTSFTSKFNVKDLRGSQAGWRVDVSASQFTDGTNKLPTGSLTLSPVDSINRVGTGSGSAPTVSMSSNQIIDDGKVEVIKAVAGSGMGVFDFEFATNALTLNIDPTTAKVGTYESTLTWDLVQAP